ncbi:MAG: hypothetical protein CSA89_00750 [Bacteroidales bacterium]|nr:MAG: hypothetical protein CSA89_00750 [Bacteroidales bacterium]
MRIISLIVLSFNVFSQETDKFLAVIPKDYYVAKNFNVLNKDNDIVISFQRDGRMTLIKEKDNRIFLKNKKTLQDSENNILAIYKRHKIIFPSRNIVVIEKREKMGGNIS